MARTRIGSTDCRPRFGWPPVRHRARDLVVEYLLRRGMELTSPNKLVIDGLTIFLDQSEFGVATTGIALLRDAPPSWARICRHVRFVALARSASEFRATQRLAFIDTRVARTSVEFAIELNELGLIAWHARVGGGLQSNLHKPPIYSSILRRSRAFAEELLATAEDPALARRVRGDFDVRMSASRARQP